MVVFCIEWKNMLRVNQRPLARQRRVLRYAYFLISGFRYKPFSTWVREGEPNPFVKQDLEVKQTHRCEIQDIFDENLR